MLNFFPFVGVIANLTHSVFLHRLFLLAEVQSKVDTTIGESVSTEHS